MPVNYRTNNFLENYNKYIKDKLGEKRIINWISFLHFIKEKNEKSLNKMINNTNLELFKTERYTKEHSILKNDNKLISKKKRN